MTAGRRSTALLDESGLTLVEVLLAIAIIGVALAALGIVVPVSSRSVQQGNQVSTATFLAEQMLERARAATWTADPAIDCLGVSTDAAPVPTGAGCPGATGTMFPDETDGVRGYPQYRRTVRVTSCATAPCAGLTTAAMRLVEVIVTYTPATFGGPSANPSAVRLAWLAAQK